MPFILINYYRTSLTAAMTSTQTTMDVASTTGLPTLGAGDILPLVLTDAATGQVHEIVYCTGISSSTLTIERGQEGTAPQAWLSGDYVSCDTTAGTVLTTNSVSATTETLDVTGNGTFGSVSSPLNVVGSGAQVALKDTTSGQATPNKYFESYQGNFVIANSANNTEILSLSDSGNLTIPGTATIAPSAASNQAVQQGQVAGATMFGGSNLVNGTSVSITTSTFTAPCDGILLLFNQYSTNVASGGGNPGLSNSAGIGITIICGNTAMSNSTYSGIMYLVAGDSFDVVATYSTTTSGVTYVSVALNCIFIPTP